MLDFSPRHNAQMQSFAQQKKDQTSHDFAIAVGRLVPVEILPEALLVKVSKGVRAFVRNPVLSLLIGFLSALEMSTKSDSKVDFAGSNREDGVNGNNVNDVSSDIADDDDESISTPIPRVKFDEIISALFAVATRFSFTVPPYFLNNVRAIGSLEGMALTADPNFSLLEVVYPFVLRKVLSDFSGDVAVGAPSTSTSSSTSKILVSNLGGKGGDTYGNIYGAIGEIEGKGKQEIRYGINGKEENGRKGDSEYVEEYVNRHDDTDVRLGSAAGQTTASGKTREVSIMTSHHRC